MRISVPIGTHLDGRAVHRIQQQRTSRISAQLQLDGAKTADDHVFEDLFGERAEGIVGIGRIQIVGKDRNALDAIRQIGECTSVLGLESATSFRRFGP